MVATGARLVAKDRMIHIQLREAKLLPFGEIDKTTERWVPLPTFKYRYNFPKWATYPNGTEFSFEENVHFVPIQYLFSKNICLQKVTFDGKHLITENQFISIRSSDLIKDASQTTIPFFDLLEVAPEISVPISGIELFHKGQFDGTSGGYISLKIYPINLTMYMNPPLNPDISNILNLTISEFESQK
ncbi:uncharacterized protein LOC122847936 [Aphidius gifuensis]|uniref:uncharacterized protein LOC122847936 n=1 Tax=Aphidius gifuensis TaxID=684658 RepID=UPI001CDCB02C|nr:uncharacterized protein LOC122847936 [Aphidius gifuensis]